MRDPYLDPVSTPATSPLSDLRGKEQVGLLRVSPKILFPRVLLIKGFSSSELMSSQTVWRSEIRVMSSLRTSGILRLSTASKVECAGWRGMKKSPCGRDGGFGGIRFLVNFLNNSKPLLRESFHPLVPYRRPIYTILIDNSVLRPPPPLPNKAPLMRALSVLPLMIHRPFLSMHSFRRPLRNQLNTLATSPALLIGRALESESLPPSPCGSSLF
jgi:hypothetical protein